MTEEAHEPEQTIERLAVMETKRGIPASLRDRRAVVVLVLFVVLVALTVAAAVVAAG